MISPFDNLSSLQISRLYDLLGVHIYRYNKGDKVLSTIRKENIICILLEGSAQIVFNEYNGNEIVMETLVKDSVFGTNISATNIDNCDIFAKSNSEVLVIDYKKLMNPKNLKHVYYNTFIYNLFEIVNSKSKERNERIRILEKKQIRDKLLEYFEIEYKKAHSKNIYPTMSLKDLADYMAVNRSAMFREIKHLKDDKLIEIKDKRITLLYK